MNAESTKKQWQDSVFRTNTTEILRQNNLDPEMKRINSESTKRQWQDTEFAESVRQTMKERWQDPEFRERVKKALNLKPNKAELKLDSILNILFPSKYKFVGDFTFFLGGKCPDFMNVNGRKLLIELYGDYWHRNDDPQERIDYFKQFGFDTLVIWEHELKDAEALSERIQEFHAYV